MSVDASAVGWVIATGALTFVNEVSYGQTTAIDWIKIPAATLAGAGIVSLISQASPELATILAVTAFFTVALAPMNGKPAPVTSVLKIFQRIGVA